MVSMVVVGMDMVSMGVVCLFEKIIQYCKEFHLRTDLILEHSCQQQQQQQKQQQYTMYIVQLYTVIQHTWLYQTSVKASLPCKELMQSSVSNRVTGTPVARRVLLIAQYTIEREFSAS